MKLYLIIAIATDTLTVSPTIVTALDESTESQYITIENLDFATPRILFQQVLNNIDRRILNQRSRLGLIPTRTSLERIHL